MNETCSNPSCGSGDKTPTPGGGCQAMGGNTVCKPYFIKGVDLWINQK